MTRRTQILLGIICAQAILAMLGSLYFSNVLLYTQCDLCWYQRICMYPMGVIAIVSLIRKDRNAVWYILPLSIIGLFISVFHVTIYTIANNLNGTVPAFCSVNGVSCTAKFLDFFGFISIPHLSFVAFVITTICAMMIAYEKKAKKA